MTGYSPGDVVLVNFVFSVRQDMINRRLGTVSEHDLRGARRKLREILDL